jgi:hypothetical protein
MAVVDLLGQSGSTQRIFEDAPTIEITRNSVKFGTSVYQFRNITGFRVGDIPKEKFPLQLFLILTVAGILTFVFVIGLIPLALAVWIIISHFAQIQKYGLILYLNSGEERIFISNDKSFLMEIVSKLYDFMEYQREESLVIDMSNHSISVGGDFNGKAMTGDRNNMY